MFEDSLSLVMSLEEGEEDNGISPIHQSDTGGGGQKRVRRTGEDFGTSRI